MNNWIEFVGEGEIVFRHSEGCCVFTIMAGSRGWCLLLLAVMFRSVSSHTKLSEKG